MSRLPEPLGAREIRGVVSDGMICSARRARHLRRSLAGSSSCPASLRAWAMDVGRAFGLDDAVLDLEIDDQPARLPLGVRDRARGGGRDRDAARASRTPPSTRTRRRPERRRPLEVVDPERCPRYLARIIRDVEHAPSPLADPGAALRRGHATDLGRRRRDELRDARDRATAASVRPRRCSKDPHRGSPRRAGRAARDPRRRGARAHRRRPADRDAERPVGDRRRDGSAAAEVSASTKEVLLESASFERGGILRTRGGSAAADRGRDPLRARHRSRSGAAGADRAAG